MDESRYALYNRHMATIVDGRALAREIQSELAHIVAGLPHAPRLDVIVVGTNPVIDSFVKRKEKFAARIGVEFVHHTLDESITTEDIVEKITYLEEKTNGIVVQLPLPEHIDTHAVIRALPASKDVDVINDDTLALFRDNKSPFVPPVAGAVKVIFDAHDVGVLDKKVVIVGKGRLVGLPVQTLLEKEGANVVMVDSSTSREEFADALKHADIVVSGAGSPNLVTKEMVREGAVLIDAGTSSAGQTIEGDIARECADVASLVSQTPGGVGPITVAVLFQNLINAHPGI